MNNFALSFLKYIQESFNQIIEKTQKDFYSIIHKENRYKVAIFFDLLCILIILTYGIGVHSKLLSPLAPYQKSYASLFVNNNSHEMFSFAPGWGFNKLNKIDFSRLDTLAYFDIPINADGSFNKDTDGYITFKSEEFAAVIQKAHNNETNVVITLSQSNNSVIEKFLNDPKSQEALIDEAIYEVQETHIEGVTIDFEFTGTNGKIYQNKFNTFISNLTEKMHQRIPNSQVSVAISGSFIRDSIYDLDFLAQKTDRIFLIAYDFAVPELKNKKTVAPEYGYSEKEYWETVLKSVEDVLAHVPSHKVVLETAWYGNGDNYPLYLTDRRDNFSVEVPTNLSYLESKTIEKLVEEVPYESRESARKNIPIIASALKDEGILSPNILAYAIATIEHETAGTFEPIEEYGGRKSARRLGYEGGTNYFGRGFIQLTHLRNYKLVGTRIGLGDKLVKNPELALNPQLSAKILAAYFKDNGIARLAENGNFIAARRPINPDNNGWLIASLASKYLNYI